MQDIIISLEIMKLLLYLQSLFPLLCEKYEKRMSMN
jgi:hypothetical protein